MDEAHDEADIPPAPQQQPAGDEADDEADLGTLEIFTDRAVLHLIRDNRVPALIRQLNNGRQEAKVQLLAVLLRLNQRLGLGVRLSAVVTDYATMMEPTDALYDAMKMRGATFEALEAFYAFRKFVGRFDDATSRGTRAKDLSMYVHLSLFDSLRECRRRKMWMLRIIFLGVRIEKQLERSFGDALAVPEFPRLRHLLPPLEDAVRGFLEALASSAAPLCALCIYITLETIASYLFKAFREFHRLHITTSPTSAPSRSKGHFAASWRGTPLPPSVRGSAAYGTPYGVRF